MSVLTCVLGTYSVSSCDDSNGMSQQFNFSEGKRQYSIIPGQCLYESVHLYVCVYPCCIKLTLTLNTGIELN